MSPTLIASLASVGAIGGFFSGLLGFGGGVVMFPPPLLPSAAFRLGEARCQDRRRGGHHTGLFLDPHRRNGPPA